MKVIVFEAFGQTWSSVASFANEFSGGDRSRYERIRTRLYKGLCTAEQAVELERYRGGYRKRRMAEMRRENEAAGVVLPNDGKGPPVPKPFAVYGGHHDGLRMHLALVEKTPYRDSTVYEVTHYCCGSTVLMTHIQVMRRKQGGFVFCQTCGLAGHRRRRAAKRIELLLGMAEEERDFVLFEKTPDDDVRVEKPQPMQEPLRIELLTRPPPSSVLQASRTSSDRWEDRMHLQWEENDR